MSLKQKKGRPKKKKTGMLMITMVVMVLGVILLYNSIGMKQQIREYAQVEQELLGQIEEQKELSEDLARQSEYIQSDEYIEQIARDKLGLVKDGDIVFKKQKSSSKQ